MFLVLGAITVLLSVPLWVLSLVLPAPFGAYLIPAQVQFSVSMVLLLIPVTVVPATAERYYLAYANLLTC